MKRFQMITSVLLALLGIIHSCFTPVFYKNLIAPDALWFLGTGLGFIFLGFFNFSLASGFTPATKVLCVLSNLIGLVFSILTVFSLNAAQAYIGVIILLLVTISSIRLKSS